MARNNKNDPTDYAVYCLGCGLQFLSRKEYMRQLGMPDTKWKCPKCGSEANWDDECRATNPPDEEDA